MSDFEALPVDHDTLHWHVHHDISDEERQNFRHHLSWQDSIEADKLEQISDESLRQRLQAQYDAIQQGDPTIPIPLATKRRELKLFEHGTGERILPRKDFAVHFGLLSLQTEVETPEIQTETKRRLFHRKRHEP